jgi:hypothetical protein
MRRRFDTPCRIEIEQSPDHFHAHVELEGDIRLHPGDKVRVHGRPIALPFGAKVIETRIATVERATPLERLLTRIKARFELGELYEVSFNPGRM